MPVSLFGQCCNMDKINNIKSAVVSTSVNTSISKNAQFSEDKTASINKATSVTQGGRTKLLTSPQNKSAVATKTLAETLQTNEEKVKDAVKEINSELKKLQSELGFFVDKVANDVVITVKRKESGEVVRQIPSETVLKLAHNFEKLKGILLDESF